MDTTTTTTAKRRAIRLTSRRPVRIIEAEWPLIAEGEGDSYASRDFSRYQQAQAQGELDEYHIRARQHADGRAIVYGELLAATAWTGTEHRYGGELLAAGEDLAAAIRRVGEGCGLPDGVIRDCVADLPAEEI